jgi:hypothetical protein
VPERSTRPDEGKSKVRDVQQPKFVRMSFMVSKNLEMVVRKPRHAKVRNHTQLYDFIPLHIDILFVVVCVYRAGVGAAAGK